MTVLDVPEVRKFRTEFQYNFFEKDEKTNDRGNTVAFGVYDENNEVLISRKVPRYVRLMFETVDVRSNVSVDNEFAVDISTASNVHRLLHKNMWRIQSETDVATRGYSSLNLQDREIETKASRSMGLAVAVRSQSETKGKKKDLPDSRADVAKLLNSVTSSRVAGNWIMKVSGKLADQGVYSYSTRTRQRRRYRSSWSRELANVNHYSQFNDKFLGSILKKSIMDPANPFAGELSNLAKQSLDLQRTARLQSNPGVISDYEFIPNFRPIMTKPVSAGTYKNAVKIIGYLVDKIEYTSDRRVRRHRPIIIAASSVSSALDSKVKYGSAYRYSIRAIAMVQFQALNEETGQAYITTGLISSRPSPSSHVVCREYNPPPPPQDLDFIWDYRDKKMMMMWSFPVTSTRDVKRFQVFRRMTVNDPYELLAEYDFDDSEIPDPRKETPRSSRVHEMDEPSTIYVDYEFTKESEYIYTLCSIDAHDFSSNYSQQFLVTFDVNTNRLVKKMISPEGAPKPYPNFYLIQNSNLGIGDVSLTSDSITDSGHQKCSIFFDPEYLSIVDEQDHDLGLLSVSTKDTEGRYKLQVINTDRQKSQIVSIDVKDLRTGK